jgi:Predicted amidohydrolase
MQRQTTIVAAIQTEPVILDVRKNLAEATQMCFEAAWKGARVIVLPELCTSGFVLRSVREAADCAQEKNGYQTEAFVPIARKFNCHIVFGYVETENGNLYNSAAVVGPTGLEANIRKRNRFGADNVWASKYESVHPVVITGAGRLGVLICSDVSNQPRMGRHDERFYRKGSIDTIALPVSWGGSDYAYPDSSWMDLAESVDVNVIVANRVGQERDMNFKGGSVIVSRDLHPWTHGSSFGGPAVVGGLAIL